MPQQIRYKGQTHTFPDNFSQEQIAAALRSYKPPEPVAPQVATKQAPQTLVAPGLPPGMEIAAQLVKGATVDPIVEGFQAIKERGEISPLTTVLGGFGGPAAGFLGSFMGQTAEQLVRGDVQNPLRTAGNAALDAGLNSILGKAVTLPMRGLSNLAVARSEGTGVRDAVKEAFLKTLFPTKNLPADVEAGRATLDTLKPTVGQLTGSPFAKFVEKGLAHSEALKRETEQQAGILDLLGKFRIEFTGRKAPQSMASLGTAAQEKVIQNRAALKAQEKAAYDKFTAIKNQNTVNIREVVGETDSVVMPGTKIPEIKVRQIAPIPLGETVMITAPERLKLDDYFGESRLQQMAEPLRRKYATAKSLLDDVLRPIRIQSKAGNTVEVAMRDYDTVNKAQSALGKILFDKKAADYTDEERILLRIYEGLNKDLEKGVQNWKVRGAEAHTMRTAARELTKERARIYNPDLMATIKTRRGPVDPEEIYNAGFKTRTSAKKLMEALAEEKGDPSEARSAYFSKVLDDAWDPANKTLNPDRIISALENPDSPGREILSSVQRAKLIQLSRALRNLGDKDTGSGQVALRIREAGMALSIGSGLLTAAQRGYLTQGGKTGLLMATVLASGRPLANALINPKNAELATRLTRIKPDSPEAKFATKALLLAMKGQQIKLQIPNIGLLDATVNEQGRVEINRHQ